MKKTGDKFTSGFKIKGFVQTPDEIAGYIIEAMKAEKPHLRYITNQTYEAQMKKKFVDVTGDAAVEATIQRFFGTVDKK